MNIEADDQLLEAASELAYRAAEQVDGRLSQIEDPLRTIYCVYHATAIIDEGGFIYFFESDFPHQPPYECFIEAYRKIGCVEEADALRAAVDSFELANPENQLGLRQDYIETHYDDSTHEVTTWNDCIGRNGIVWHKLADWIRRQPSLQHLQKS